MLGCGSGIAFEQFGRFSHNTQLRALLPSAYRPDRDAFFPKASVRARSARCAALGSEGEAEGCFRASACGAGPVPGLVPRPYRWVRWWLPVAHGCGRIAACGSSWSACWSEATEDAAERGGRSRPLQPTRTVRVATQSRGSEHTEFLWCTGFEIVKVVFRRFTFAGSRQAPWPQRRSEPTQSSSGVTITALKSHRDRAVAAICSRRLRSTWRFACAERNNSASAPTGTSAIFVTTPW